MSFIRNLFILVCLLATFSSYALERARPQTGEGIYAFLRRHNRDDKQDYQKFIELNKGKFGKQNSLLSNVSYVLPPVAGDAKKQKKANNVERQPVKNKKPKTGYQPLFGKKYAHYEIIDNELKGACFFLVSEHGGPDCGATATVNGHELYEDEYAYDVMLRLARKLLQHGATVHIIIQDPHDGIRDDKYLKYSRDETCMGLTIPLNQTMRLRQRTDKVNSLSAKANEKYQRAIFIHLDSRNYTKRLDAFFWYQDKSPDRKKSQSLAETMCRTFKTQYEKNQPGRGFSGKASPPAKNVFVLRNTKPVSILVELGNIKNKIDQQRFISDRNRQHLADWMALGFMQDYRNSKLK